MADDEGAGASKDIKGKGKKDKEDEVLAGRKRGRPKGSSLANAQDPALFRVRDRVLLKTYTAEAEVDGSDENLACYVITTITELTQKESGEVLYCLRKVDGTVLNKVPEYLLTKSVQL